MLCDNSLKKKAENTAIKRLFSFEVLINTCFHLNLMFLFMSVCSVCFSNFKLKLNKTFEVIVLEIGVRVFYTEQNSIFSWSFFNFIDKIIRMEIMILTSFSQLIALKTVESNQLIKEKTLKRIVKMFVVPSGCQFDCCILMFSLNVNCAVLKKRSNLIMFWMNFHCKIRILKKSTICVSTPGEGKQDDCQF